MGNYFMIRDCLPFSKVKRRLKNMDAERTGFFCGRRAFGRTVCQILAAFVLFLAGTKLLNYLYWQEEDWERILFHHFYAQEKNIDNICLGSSHVFCGFDPEILDEKSGKNNFNLATSGQSLMGSYYLLKEADRCNEIEKVYLELYYTCSTGGQGRYQEKEAVQISWRITDYMKMSPLKLEAFFHMNPSKYYMDGAFPYVRYRAHLTEKDWIEDRVTYKRTGNYKKYIYVDGLTEYEDKGYYRTAKEFSNPLFVRERRPEEMHLTEDAEKYLRKIIEYCQKKEISIVLCAAPMYELEPLSTESYDSYAEGIRSVAAEYDVPYYDFNMVKEEYLPIQHPEYFMDAGHLNTSGAEMYTNFFHKVVSAPEEENAEYFYGSYQEKLESAEPRVYGLYCTMIDGKKRQDEEVSPGLKMTVAALGEDKVECRIFLTPTGGETYMLQDFSENKEFDVSAEEHGICHIVWRKMDGAGEEESLEVLY